MNDQIDRQNGPVISTSTARSAWLTILAVGVPALVYLVVAVNQYDGRHYLRGDCQYYFYTAVSLLQDQDIDLANQLPPPLGRHSDDVALDQKGRLVPKHPIWMAIFSIPFIFVFGMPGALVFNQMQLVLLLILTLRLTRRFASALGASLATCLTGFATILPHYAWNFSPDIFSCLMLLAGLVALPADRAPNRTRHVLSGIFLGIAAISKFSLFFAIPGIPLICGRPLKKTLAALSLGFAGPMILWCCLNAYLFGSPLTTSYDRMAQIEGNTIVVHSQRSDFDRPIMAGVRDQIVDPAHGLLFTSPITLLSLVGLIPLARKDRGAALYLVVTFLSVFLFFSTYEQWAASHFGNRFLIPIMVLATVPLASLIDWFVYRRTRFSAKSR